MSNLFAEFPQPKGKSPGAMLNTRDVARIFNVHPSTIRRWCEQGKIKTYRTGPRGTRMFKREDIAVAYLDRSIQRFIKNM